MDALTRDLCRLADGERDAFDPVWDAAWPRVRALSGRLLGDSPDAEDAAQQAMVNVFRRSCEFDPQLGRGMPWILGITAWECRTWRRKHVRRREGELPCTLVHDVDLEAELIAGDLQQALTDVIGTMSAQDQATFRAVLDQCERPDIPAATFRKRVQRALSRLRAAWSTSHG